jgi:hypothetical protein
MEIFQIILSAFAVIIAIISAIIARNSVKIAELSVREQRGADDLTALREFVLHEYVERQFRPTQAITINRSKVTSLREAKSKAMKVYRQNPSAWDKASQFDNQGAWQNRVAYETADILQKLGAATFTGSIPLRMLLAIVGDAVVDDWVLCRTWVKSYRESQHTISQAYVTHGAAIHYYRRHAEWLVLVTVAWMTRYWSYTNCSLIAEWYGGVENIPDAIRRLSSADGMLIPQVVKNDIKSLTGIDI